MNSPSSKKEIAKIKFRDPRYKEQQVPKLLNNQSFGQMWDNEDLFSNLDSSTYQGTGPTFVTLQDEQSKDEREFRPNFSNLTFKSEMSTTFRGSKTKLPSIDPSNCHYEYSKRV